MSELLNGIIPNIQGLNSINSILDKVNKKLNFYIIHNSPYKFEQMVKELSSYKEHNFTNISPIPPRNSSGF